MKIEIARRGDLTVCWSELGFEIERYVEDDAVTDEQARAFDEDELRWLAVAALPMALDFHPPLPGIEIVEHGPEQGQLDGQLAIDC